MLTVNIHDAKTRLSELIARAVAGEPFIIAKAGKPMVKVEALVDVAKPKPPRIGFAKHWTMPSDAVWAEMDGEIERTFEDGPPLDVGGSTSKQAA